MDIARDERNVLANHQMILEETRSEVRALQERLETIVSPQGFLQQPPRDGTLSLEVDSLISKVRSVVRFRDLRRNVFAADIFADPAWDLLLDIFVCDLSQQRMSVTAACHSARVPQTTALRWLRVLEDAGLIVRSNDPMDGRRVFVSLTEEAFTKMRILVESREFRAI